jgi:hypothetical protein
MQSKTNNISKITAIAKSSIKQYFIINYANWVRRIIIIIKELFIHFVNIITNFFYQS